MSKFTDARIYGQGWEEQSREQYLTKSDLKLVDHAEVITKEVKSKFDDELHEVTSICFFLKTGGFVPCQLSNRSELVDGDKVDPASVEIITFSDADGEEHIRYDGKAIDD